MQVTSSHALMFVKSTVGEKSSPTIPVFFDAQTFSLKPSDTPVEVPAWVASDPHFKAARAAGWIVADGENGADEAHTSLLAHHSDETLFEEFHRRMMDVGRDFESKAQNFFAAKQDEEDASYIGRLAKFSGIDGDAGDWTAAGMDATGFPVEKGSTEDVTPVSDADSILQANVATASKAKTGTTGAKTTAKA